MFQKEFVEEHYGDQIRRLKEEHPGEYPELTSVLEECCDDEVCARCFGLVCSRGAAQVHHRNEAAALFMGADASPDDRVVVPTSGLWWLWGMVVTFGSKSAVVVAKAV